VKEVVRKERGVEGAESAVLVVHEAHSTFSIYMANACLYIVLIVRQKWAPSAFVGYVVNKMGIGNANRRTPKMKAPSGRETWSWLDRTELGKFEERGIELEKGGVLK
jgi:hypothetical protein